MRMHTMLRPPAEPTWSIKVLLRIGATSNASLAAIEHALGGRSGDGDAVVLHSTGRALSLESDDTVFAQQVRSLIGGHKLGGEASADGLQRANADVCW